MYQTIKAQSELSVKKIVDKILISGKLSRQDHSLLTAIVFNNGEIKDNERRQINRIFDRIQAGQLKLVDW